MVVENRFLLLPEGCIETIVSLTSPKDVCRFSAISSGFRSATESDVVWERFLPPDYEDVIARSVSPVVFATKKELYFKLCDSPLLLDEGKLSLRLSRSSSKKCYTLPASELHIAWKQEPMYWQLISLPESRFGEVTELLSVCWLDIRDLFQSQMLSPDTNYATYLVFKLRENHSGFDNPTKASVRLVKEGSAEVEEDNREVYLTPSPCKYEWMVGGTWRRVPVTDAEGRVPSRRADDWMELELGEVFINGGGEHGASGEVQVGLSETENLNWKSGLVVEGIELRPKEE